MGKLVVLGFRTCGGDDGLDVGALGQRLHALLHAHPERHALLNQVLHLRQPPQITPDLSQEHGDECSLCTYTGMDRWSSVTVWM